MALTIEAVSATLSVDATGTVRVHGTRLTLDAVLGAYERGDTPQEIVEVFPDLDLADVHAIIAYYLRNRDAVDAYLQEGEANAAGSARRLKRVRGVKT